MKIFIPTIIFLLFSFNISYSQTQKGSFVVSGGTNVSLLLSNLDVNNEDVPGKNLKLQDYSVHAGIGYFIIDNLALNISSTYDFSYSKSLLNEENIEKTWSVLPSISYVFPVEGSLRPVINFGAGYISLIGRNNQNVTQDNVVYHFAGLALTGSAGASYFINKSFSVDLNFQYSRNKLNDQTKTSRSQLQNIYGVMTGLSVYF